MQKFPQVEIGDRNWGPNQNQIKTNTLKMPTPYGLADPQYNYLQTHSVANQDHWQRKPNQEKRDLIYGGSQYLVEQAALKTEYSPKSALSAKKDFNLDISDIQGAKPRNLKYLDQGVRKKNFYGSDHKINEYYNNMNHQKNSVVDGIIKEQFKYHPVDPSKRDRENE